MHKQRPRTSTPIVPRRATARAAAVFACVTLTLPIVALADEPASDSTDSSSIESPSADSSAEPQSSTSEPARDDALTEAIVTLHSGRSITGFLIEESSESVVIRINGIDTTFPRARVAQVQRLAPVEERYHALRGSVEDNDIRARMALVDWLRARRAYRLALHELSGILEIDPTNHNARTIRDWIQAHLALESAGERKRDDRPAREPRAPEMPTLTPEQINRIRIFEIDLRSDTRLSVPESTMRTLMTRHPEAFPVDADEREKILDAEPIDQLRMLFELRARDLYDTVTVREDPPSMATFKTRVHGAGGWLVNACASNRCHGGSEAGRLRLINRRANSDETAYTNFLILDRFTLADGTPLINHEEPDRSPLLQMALPRHDALIPHPEVDASSLGQDWRFVHRSTRERRYRETVDWIASLYRPRPDYGIEYPPTEQTPSPDEPAPTEPRP